MSGVCLDWWWYSWALFRAGYSLDAAQVCAAELIFKRQFNSGLHVRNFIIEIQIRMRVNNGSNKNS